MSVRWKDEEEDASQHVSTNYLQEAQIVQLRHEILKLQSCVFTLISNGVNSLCLEKYTQQCGSG